MRLPWWPYYIDASVSDTSVHYSTPDGREHSVGFNRIASLKWNSSNKFCWPIDKRNARVRFRGCAINLRVKPSMQALVDGVLQREEFRIVCDPQQVERHNKRTTWIMVLGVSLVPGSLLGMFLFLGKPEVAENPIGQRVLVGLAIFKIAMLFIALIITAVGLHQLRTISKCKRLKCVSQDGILAAHPNSEDVFIPYHKLLTPTSACGIHFVQTADGQMVLLPHRQLIHNTIIRANTDPQQLPPLRPVLWLAIPLILAGPAHYLWNMYLIPDEPYANELFRYFILPSMGIIVLIDVSVRRWWKSRRLKRRTAHSQE